jgi:hypothetical protein
VGDFNHKLTWPSIKWVKQVKLMLMNNEIMNKKGGFKMTNESHFLKLLDLMDHTLSVLYDEYDKRFQHPESHPTFVEIYSQYKAITEHYPNLRTVEYHVPDYFEPIHELSTTESEMEKNEKD